MSAQHDSDQPDDLPPLSYEDVRWRWTLEALVVAMGRKRGEKCLRALGDIARTEIELEMVLPIRARSDHKAVMREKRKAAASVAAYMPTLRARLPPE